MRDALAAEWLKLRSVRSTMWILGTVVVCMLLCVLWAWYAARSSDGSSAQQREVVSAPADQPLTLALPLCAMVLGSLTITSEYATGMIRVSAAASPRRLRLLSAKALVAGAVALAAGLVSVSVVLLAGKAIVGDRPVEAFETPVTGHVPHLLATGAATAAITVVTVGLGAVLRSGAATITLGVMLLFVLPTLIVAVPSPYGERIWSVLPGTLSEQMASPPGLPYDYGVLSAPAAAGLLAVYVAAALGTGAYVFCRRDV
ncbi:ABC transporter permease [Actinomadura graeca]|uniref:ABC transporter permease n=1 Tax=Actinomadura graeca TaxID=2750812 RepID=A0ABX8R6G6_9ACTN|nr:ABC transporter permease [Actinomadura graeca]QXJ26014.1 ABC transporter permease [Actinomadura graeca]